MIHSVYSPTLKSFKTLTFRPGLNLVVATKSPQATERQTVNGAGKSSFVQIVHFLLGGKCGRSSLFRTPTLIDETFGIDIDLSRHRLKIERSGSVQAKIRIVAGDDSQFPKAAKVDKKTGLLTISNAQWRDELGETVFEIPIDHPPYSPTFRSMFGFFARQQDDGGFQKAESHTTDADDRDMRTALSYLLDLDWTIPREMRETYERSRSLKVLSRELKRDVTGRLLEPIGELQSAAAISERRLLRLEAELRDFKVLPEYRALEAEASDIAIAVSNMANENTSDLEAIAVFETALTEEAPPADRDLIRVYEEAGVVVAPEARQRFEAAREFHESVLKNRKQHLEKEIEELRSRVERRQNQMSAIDGRRRQILQTLSSHGALDQFTKLQGEATQLRSALADTTRKLDLARRAETAKADIVLENAQLHKRLVVDHREHESTIKDAILQFEELSEGLSEREGTLRIVADQDGPKFSVQGPTDRSKAVKGMLIFCFDMTLAILSQRRGRGPGFLIHDSHLFDGMDPRQIGNALRIGAEASKREGFQYIVTINFDVFEHPDLLKQFDPNPYVVPVDLTDATEDGGLFGKRFD